MPETNGIAVIVKSDIKILVVDDREDNLFSIETILDKDGYIIRKANSGTITWTNIFSAVSGGHRANSPGTVFLLPSTNAYRWPAGWKYKKMELPPARPSHYKPRMGALYPIRPSPHIVSSEIHDP